LEDEHGERRERPGDGRDLDVEERAAERDEDGGHDEVRRGTEEAPEERAGTDALPVGLAVRDPRAAAHARGVREEGRHEEALQPAGAVPGLLHLRDVVRVPR